MANTIRIKRGLKANIANLTLLPGEIAVALDTQELYVGDQNGNVQIIKAGTSGSVQSAEKLTTARNIAISGDATGSASFDGSKDISIALALANSGVTAGTYNNVTVNEKGLITSATNKTYTIEDITGLQDALNTKLPTATYNSDMLALNNSLNTINKTLEEKANEAEVYTKSEVDSKIAAKDSLPSQSGNTGKFLTTDGTTASWGTVDLSSKADKTSVYTKEEADALLDGKASTTTLNEAKLELQNSINTKANIATTLSGYGISDAYTKSQVDGMVAGTFHFKGEKDSYDKLPTDAKTGDVWQVGEKEYAYNGTNWIELGFNIDLSAYITSEAVAADYATKNELSTAQTTLQNNINTKANSDDVYNKTTIDSKLAEKATTTSVTNLERRVETNESSLSSLGTTVANKADKSTTLAGYGITDAYTKTEINTKVTTLTNAVNSKLGIDSVIDGGEFGSTSFGGGTSGGAN